MLLKPLRKLFPHQQDYLSSVANRRRKLALFWEMRLGKSLTIIRWIKSFDPTPSRILIICPKSTIISWSEELLKENIEPFILTTKEKQLHHLINEGWCVTNYEAISVKGSTIADLPWDAVILDEAHKIKDPTTQITKLFTDPNKFPFSTSSSSKENDDNLYPYDKSDFVSNSISSLDLHNMGGKVPTRRLQLRAILTGTPAPESYLNYFSQFKFLFGKLGQYTNYYQFKADNFQLSDERNSHRYIPKYSFIRSMAGYIDKHAHTLTRKKLKIELPHIHEKRYVQMSPEYAKMYKSFEKDWFLRFVTEAVEGGQLATQSPAQLMTKFAIVAQNYLHQLAVGFPKQAPEICGNHKLKELLTLLNTELQKEKVVIWCRYARDINEIYKALYPLKCRRVPLKFDGTMNQKQCERAIERFNLQPNTASGQCQAADTLICQIVKGSLGMDFSVADTQIFFSRPWSSMQNTQATDRLVHLNKLGRKDFSNLLTIDILTEDTIDVDLYDALLEKKADANVFKFFLKRTGFEL